MPKASPIQPLKYFCCGCSLDTGVTITLAGHTFVSLLYIFTTWSNIVLDRPSLGYRLDPATQAFNFGFALLGLPFIASGVSGLRYHHETHLRFYLYWLMFTLALDSTFVIIHTVENSCVNLPNLFVKHGAAFTCGIIRLVSIGTVLVYLCIMGYAMFTVWSRCIELELIGSAPCLQGLLMQARHDEAAMVYQHRSGLFGTGPTPPQGHALAYGSLASPEVGGSTNIFGGTRHDVNFPPSAVAARRGTS